MWRVGVCVAGMLIAVGTAGASQKILPHVPPSAPGHPGIASWPLRMFGAGMEVFSRQRHYAPAARLSFRLKTEPRSRLDGLNLELDGEDWRMPKLDRDGTFTLERNADARDSNGWIISNRSFAELGTSTIWVRVRTPGLPENMYRMGDLRLQCQVFTVMSYVGTPRMSYEDAILSADDNHCKRSSGFPITYAISLDQPVMQAFILQGGTRIPIMVEPAFQRLYVPIHDEAWSDDALIEVLPAK